MKVGCAGGGELGEAELGESEGEQGESEVSGVKVKVSCGN